ncbi:S-adenosyl-L-methionine-dependent methyltransferase [Fomitopsis serialis]|uniref:S-adenosyl-L-methionine-dependent methyltransferase n=1 Tax=Fomitopsis serialis TaxID=139415 RepID=UPI00200895C0|nr:S-adenosyl-L-methionine-dependent methyltransferase [Neoantrodia serialis]KAH9929392.1 S-adenosyl-L-methionine-dependent methyltransferase [Neoantrodia serialis]
MAIERYRIWSTPGTASSDEEIHSDTSSELTELHPDEFPRYFDERNGRLFHSHGHSPYPLPVDADEQHRQNRQHALLYSLIGAHFKGPVRDVLRPVHGLQRQAVDLGTGTGRWVMDVAGQFPHVRFSGIDIVPIQTRHPLRNVWFEMHDLDEPLGYAPGSVDLIHARDIHLAVRDFPRLLREVARALRPGGLYISGEWFGYPVMKDGSRISERAPRIHRFFDLVNYYLGRDGIGFVAASIPEWVRLSGAFVGMRVEDVYVPIGSENLDPRSAGERLKANLRVFATSMQLWLVEKRYCGRAAAQDLVNGFILEVNTIEGMELQYRVVYARKA